MPATKIKPLNLELALKLARKGYYVFPVAEDKTPYRIKGHLRADTDYTQEERTQLAAAYRSTHNDNSPVHIGSTVSIDVVKRIWTKLPDAGVGIACGPSKIVVIDADVKPGKNGVELVGALFDNLGVPHDGKEGCVVVETQSGGRHHYFRDPDNSFTNRSGGLKAELNCDVRARGGYVVAGGTRLANGKAYRAVGRSLADISPADLPTLPAAIADRIRGNDNEARQASDATAVAAVKSLTPAIVNAVINNALPDVAPLLAGRFNPHKLAERHENVRAVLDDFNGDHSQARFVFASAWKSEGATDLELASLLLNSEIEELGTPLPYSVKRKHGEPPFVLQKNIPDKGEFNLRNVVRDIARAPAHRDLSVIFGIVEDDDAVIVKLKDGGEAKSVRKRIKEIDLRDIKQYLVTSHGDEIVQRTIPSGSVGLLYGASQSGKTTIAVDLAAKVSLGLPWHGLETKRGGVYYVAAENPQSIAARLAAWLEAHPEAVKMCDNPPLRMRAATLDLTNAGDVSALIESVKAFERETGVPCALIVLDTLSRVMPAGAEENSAKDMRAVIGALHRIRDKTGATTFAVAHTGKSDPKSPRGSNLQIADVDWMLPVGREKDRRFVYMSHERGAKFRDGSDNRKPLEFHFVVIPIAVEGSDMESVVAVEGPRDPSSAIGAVEEPDASAVVEHDDTDDRVRPMLSVLRSMVDYRRKSGGLDAGKRVNEIDVQRIDLLKAFNTSRETLRSGDGKRLPSLNTTMLKRALSVAHDRGLVVFSSDSKQMLRLTVEGVAVTTPAKMAPVVEEFDALD